MKTQTPVYCVGAREEHEAAETLSGLDARDLLPAELVARWRGWGEAGSMGPAACAGEDVVVPRPRKDSELARTTSEDLVEPTDEVDAPRLRGF